MNVVETSVRKITVTGAPSLDPIAVILEDWEPGRGQITISCYGKSWTAYWGGMGERAIAQFFVSCDEHYLAGNLSGIPHEVFDPEHLKESLKRELLADRRKMNISGGFARERFNAINELDIPETEAQLWAISRDMERLIGEEWWYSIPKKMNPDYDYLCRIIRAVQEALRTMQ